MHKILQKIAQAHNQLEVLVKQAEPGWFVNNIQNPLRRSAVGGFLWDVGEGAGHARDTLANSAAHLAGNAFGASPQYHTDIDRRISTGTNPADFEFAPTPKFRGMNTFNDPATTVAKMHPTGFLSGIGQDGEDVQISGSASHLMNEIPYANWLRQGIDSVKELVNRTVPEYESDISQAKLNPIAAGRNPGFNLSSLNNKTPEQIQALMQGNPALFDRQLQGQIYGNTGTNIRIGNQDLAIPANMQEVMDFQEGPRMVSKFIPYGGTVANIGDAVHDFKHGRILEGIGNTVGAMLTAPGAGKFGHNLMGGGVGWGAPIATGRAGFSAVANEALNGFKELAFNEAKNFSRLNPLFRSFQLIPSSEATQLANVPSMVEQGAALASRFVGKSALTGAATVLNKIPGAAQLAKIPGANALAESGKLLYSYPVTQPVMIGELDDWAKKLKNKFSGSQTTPTPVQHQNPLMNNKLLLSGLIGTLGLTGGLLAWNQYNKRKQKRAV